MGVGPSRHREEEEGLQYSAWGSFQPHAFREVLDASVPGTLQVLNACFRFPCFPPFLPWGLGQASGWRQPSLWARFLLSQMPYDQSI